MSSYIDYLKSQGLTDVHIGQTTEAIANAHASHPIDWFVYSSALSMENPDHPELVFTKEQGIKTSKRDEFITQFLADKNLKMIAIAGTHGKTTTTGMTVWLMQELGIPISYLLPAKTSFASLGKYDENAEYFVYECDEYDRNFLAYNPALSLITGIDWDHPDIYPTREEYNQAFRDFINQSAHTYIWQPDAERAAVIGSATCTIIRHEDYSFSTLPGEVNRQNAALVAKGISTLTRHDDITTYFAKLNRSSDLWRRVGIIGV